MARRNSSTSNNDASQNAEGQVESQTEGQDAVGQTENPEGSTVENPQAPERPLSGEGNQAGSATGEETEHGAEQGESDVGALTAEGDGATTTHMEAVQRTGDYSGADGEIPPGSTGTRSPDPELANNLGQNDKTAARTEQSQEDREAGADRRTPRKAMNDKEALEEINGELREAEDAVAKAVAYRDDLRTQFDRLTERMAASNATPFGDITAGYFAAADARAKEEADARKQLSALGLGGILAGRTV